MTPWKYVSDGHHRHRRGVQEPHHRQRSLSRRVELCHQTPRRTGALAREIIYGRSLSTISRRNLLEKSRCMSAHAFKNPHIRCLLSSLWYRAKVAVLNRPLVPLTSQSLSII